MNFSKLDVEKIKLVRTFSFSTDTFQLNLQLSANFTVKHPSCSKNVIDSEIFYQFPYKS